MILTLISWNDRTMGNYRDDKDPLRQEEKHKYKYKKNGRGIEKEFVKK